MAKGGSKAQGGGGKVKGGAKGVPNLPSKQPGQKSGGKRTNLPRKSK